ncbi:hypothetical protein [Enterococcus faecalis]|uniref:hypothetical protein n=1 Tax=Enterococcus faecalis TaxID=1351 RepID=UPI003B304305
MSKKTKWFGFLMSLLMVLNVFVGAGISAYASETNSTESYDEFEEQLINQYASDLEFIYENAAVIDTEGNIEQINLTVLREKYGNNEFFDYLEEDFGPNAIRPRANFVECMKTEFQKIIGLDIAKQIFSPEVKKLLASKAWKKASEVIVRTLGKKLGKKALQKIVSKMIPGGIPAQIVFSAGKCGIKAIL